jgi:tRNA(Ile)-lysidine synthase
MYDSPMQGSSKGFADSVLASLPRHWLKAGDRLGIAVSGGADSVALLRATLELRDELGIVLSAVHFNHTLRGEESEGDHAFVRDLAARHGLQLHDARGDVARRAQEHSLSTEAAAREARYEFFWSLIETDRLDKIATAHTLDDQAETVLLRLIRGTGTRGLGGIHPELTGPVPSDRISQGRASQGQASRGIIIRPLLHMRRRDIESYLASLGQPWREDSSNRDLHHTRNRVRQSLIPLLERDFNPEITERLADFAEIALAEEDYWESELCELGSSNPLQVDALLALPLALRRRVVRAVAPAGLQLEFRQVDSILEVAEGRGNALTTCNLHSGWTFQREGDSLAFVPPKPQERAPKGLSGPILNALRLPVPGEVSDLGTGRRFQARRILLASPPAGYNPEHLYAPHALPSELIVRTWRFGDRFWPAHTKAPKKLKELFQEKKIAAELRPSWPVMVAAANGSGGHEDIVWAQGLPAPAHLRPQPSDGEAILLLEITSRTK